MRGHPGLQSLTPSWPHHRCCRRRGPSRRQMMSWQEPGLWGALPLRWAGDPAGRWASEVQAWYPGTAGPEWDHGGQTGQRAGQAVPPPWVDQLTRGDHHLQSSPCFKPQHCRGRKEHMRSIMHGGRPDQSISHKTIQISCRCDVLVLRQSVTCLPRSLTRVCQILDAMLFLHMCPRLAAMGVETRPLRADAGHDPDELQRAGMENVRRAQPQNESAGLPLCHTGFLHALGQDVKLQPVHVLQKQGVDVCQVRHSWISTFTASSRAQSSPVSMPSQQLMHLLTSSLQHACRETAMYICHPLI